jgi:hypothetical protein
MWHRRQNSQCEIVPTLLEGGPIIVGQNNVFEELCVIRNTYDPSKRSVAA